MRRRLQPRPRMTSFPSSIEVQLHAEGDAPIANMLVVLEVNHQGRYYYGTHLGLTDLRGRVHTAWENVAHDFAADRRTFVMDYRVPLDDCDPDAVVRVDGGKEFEVRRTQLLAELVPQSLISPT